jgi:hypothetical protein
MSKQTSHITYTIEQILTNLIHNKIERKDHKRTQKEEGKEKPNKFIKPPCKNSKKKKLSSISSQSFFKLLTFAPVALMQTSLARRRSSWKRRSGGAVGTSISSPWMWRRHASSTSPRVNGRNAGMLGDALHGVTSPKSPALEPLEFASN